MDRYPIEELFKNILKIISKYFDIYQKLVQKHSCATNYGSDPLQLNKLCIKLFSRIISDPDLMIKHQMSFFKGQLATIEAICQQVFPARREIGAKDKRFKDKIWQEHLAFAWIKDAYFTYSEWLESIVNDFPNDFSTIEIRRLNFIIKQFLDAMAPSNFPSTNPQVLREFFDTSGENFLKGLDNLLKDIENSRNVIQIKNNDGSRFILGENIAATEGKVVYQNKIMQLLHYKPLTEEQHEIPLLIVSPFINKYYILDLQQENSLVKWLLEQKYNVFLISWANPGESLVQEDFSDYMLNGPIAALDYLSNNLNIKQVNAMGYCIGGTLLAVTLAYMKSINDERIKTASFFTTLIDFENAGDLSIFIDDHFINEVEKYMESSGGYIDGKEISIIFSLLRSNDMIWPFYINNYLLGKDVFPFDILYWNEDSIRMPMALHLFCLKNFYKDNLLKIVNGLVVNDQAIDIAKIDIPCFFIGAKGDHIVPWENAFNSAKLFSGLSTFILSDSGHVAGMINHPNKNKYCYWVNDVDLNEYKDPKEWFNDSNKHQGSWWPYWSERVVKYSGKLLNSKDPCVINPNIIEEAPGSYVKIRY